MASNPRRSGNTDLVPPKMRRQARVIFYPLKCDKCQKHGLEVNQCNFTANSRILCRTCITSLGPCVRCGKDAYCRLTSVVDRSWWRYVFSIWTWMVLTCLGYAALHVTNHPQDHVRLSEAILHLTNSLMNSLRQPGRPKRGSPQASHLTVTRSAERDSCRRMVSRPRELGREWARTSIRRMRHKLQLQEVERAHLKGCGC